MLLIRSWKSISISLSGMRPIRMTRPESSVSVSWMMPRFSPVRFIMSPMYSFGHMRYAFTIGSEMVAMKFGSGR